MVFSARIHRRFVWIVPGALLVSLFPVGAVAADESGVLPEAPPGARVVTIAGTGEEGFSGDGGPATLARLNTENSTIDVAPDGTIHLADPDGRVRAITPGGSIESIADRAALGSAPRATATAADGSVYVTTDAGVRRIMPDGQIVAVTADAQRDDPPDLREGVPAAESQVWGAGGIAVGPGGEVFVADQDAGRVRVIATDGTITTVADPAELGFAPTDSFISVTSSVMSLAVDTKGEIYAALASGLSALAPSHEAGVARIGVDGAVTPIEIVDGNVVGLAVDDDGTLYVADREAGMVVMVDGSGAVEPVPTHFHALSDLAVGPDGILYVLTGERLVEVHPDELDPDQFDPDRAERDPGADPWADEEPGTIVRLPHHLDSLIAEARADRAPGLKDRTVQISGVAVGPDGAVYYSDTTNHRVRKVDDTGTITDVAGTGTRGDTGDGGPADLGQLHWPRGLTFDAAGNLYIADSGNHRIRVVDTAGDIGTVAGTVAGDGDLGDGGPAVDAALAEPHDVAVDAAGNVYVTDTAHRRIRRVAADGTITTIAGRGGNRWTAEPVDPSNALDAFLTGAKAIAVDASGTVYVTDDSVQITRIEADARLVTVAGAKGRGSFSGDGGPATSAQFNGLAGVAVDDSGTLYVADEFNARIRRIDNETATVTTIAGTGDPRDTGDGGPAVEASISEPAAVALDGSGALVVASRSGVIRRIDEDGTITTVADVGSGSDDEPTVSRAMLENAWLSIDADGTVSVLTFHDDEVYDLGDDGTVRRRENGASPGSVIGGGRAAVDASGTAYVAHEGMVLRTGDPGPSTVVGADVSPYDPDQVDVGDLAVSASMTVADMSVGGDGALLMLTDRDRTVWRVGADGVLAAYDPGDVGKEPRYVGAIAAGPEDDVYVAAVRDVVRIDADGSVTPVAGTEYVFDPEDVDNGDGGSALEARITPADVAPASDGTVYVLDGSDIRRIGTDGIITTVLESDLGNGATVSPAESTLGVDPHGNVYFVDEVSGDVIALVRPNEITPGVPAAVWGAGAAALVVVAGGGAFWWRRRSRPEGPSPVLTAS